MTTREMISSDVERPTIDSVEEGVDADLHVSETWRQDPVSNTAVPRNESMNESHKSRVMPDATYRFQFHAGFTFRQAREQVPYLASLGVTHVYASPYLKAVAGSQHGYDIVDQTSLNPEIGTEQDFAELVEELHAHGLGLILDVVPNHMGVQTNDNAWWMDVLENGPSSPYASYFDIDWTPLKPDLANKVLLPVLGDQFGRVLEDGQLTLHFEDGSFFVQYFERRFPIGLRSSMDIFKYRLDRLEQSTPTTAEDPVERDPSAENESDVSRSEDLMEYQSILTAISHLPPQTETDPEKIREGRREQEVIKRRVRELCQSSSDIKNFIEENVRLFNGVPGDPSSFDLLDQLLLAQAYRLAFWRVAADEVNYRRFFDVNALAAICMENPAVFEKTHSLILKMIKQGQVDGLRIDHPDGLYDPRSYLQTLRQFDVGTTNTSQVSSNPSEVLLDGPKFSGAEDLASNGGESNAPIYLVVEKILGRNEHIPDEWPIDGTTGYDFLNVVNGLFVDRNHSIAFDRLYAKFIREPVNFRELVYKCKKQVMDVSMSSEISVIAHRLDSISEQNRTSRDFTLNSLSDTLREIIACFPVYRTYIDQRGVSDQDAQFIEQAVARAKRRNPAISASTFDFVRDVLLLKTPANLKDSARQEWLKFVRKFQQVTGPVMAKAVEDTAFYSYNRLVSLNEVGGDPDKFGTAVSVFHQYNLDRQAHWPHGMLTLSTHDTKRSEDVRARLNILSEIPGEWQRHLSRWARVNARNKQEVDGEPAPCRNDEYLLYQTLIGTWPLEGLNSDTRPQYLHRIQDYMLKAIHEAKVHSSWISPHEPYDQSLASFIAKLLAESPKNAFLVDFVPFTEHVSKCGFWNSLSQTLLKLTSPGVPDTYQGCELWDFSLVDPDNRRPVDYDVRRDCLKKIQSQIEESPNERSPLLRDLLDHPEDGRLKMFVNFVVLGERRRDRELFVSGGYLPLEASGPQQEHVVAFARQAGAETILVVVPRLISQLTEFSGAAPLGDAVWHETKLILPEDFARAQFQNLFTNQTVAVESNDSGHVLMLRDLTAQFPLAILRHVPFA